MSPESWSLALQIAAVLASAALGWLLRGGLLVLYAVLLGLLAAVVGQLFIMGGGEGFLAGLVILPLYCVIAAALIRAGRRRLLSRRRRSAALVELIAAESARELSALAGSEPQLRPTPWRRAPPA